MNILLLLQAFSNRQGLNPTVSNMTAAANVTLLQTALLLVCCVCVLACAPAGVRQPLQVHQQHSRQRSCRRRGEQRAGMIALI